MATNFTIEHNKSDFGLLEDTAAWKCASSQLQNNFRLYMRNKVFGREQTLEAFAHYAAGWNRFVSIALNSDGPLPAEAIRMPR